jgi:hypothetical protein
MRVRMRVIFFVLVAITTVPSFAGQIGECDSCITRKVNAGVDPTDPNAPAYKISTCWPDSQGTIPDCHEVFINEYTQICTTTTTVSNKCNELISEPLCPPWGCVYLISTPDVPMIPRFTLGI